MILYLGSVLGVMCIYYDEKYPYILGKTLPHSQKKFYDHRIEMCNT